MHAYVITFWWVKKNFFFLLLSMSIEEKRVFLTGHQHLHRCIWRDVQSFKGSPLCIKLRCTFVLFLCASGNRSKFSPKIKKVTKDRPFKRIKKSSFFLFLSNKVCSESAQSFLDYKAWLVGSVLRCNALDTVTGIWETFGAISLWKRRIYKKSFLICFLTSRVILLSRRIFLPDISLDL